MAYRVVECLRRRWRWRRRRLRSDLREDPHRFVAVLLIEIDSPFTVQRRVPLQTFQTEQLNSDN